MSTIDENSPRKKSPKKKISKANVKSTKVLTHTTAYFNEFMFGYKRHLDDIKPKNESIVKVVLQEKNTILKERREEGIAKQEDSLDEITNDDRTKKSINKLYFKNDIFKRNSPQKKQNKVLRKNNSMNSLGSLTKKSNSTLLTKNKESQNNLNLDSAYGTLNKNASTASLTFLPKLDSTQISFRNTNVNFINLLDKTIHNNKTIKKDVSKMFFDLARSVSVGNKNNKNIDPKKFENEINQEYTNTLRNTMLFKSTSRLLKSVVSH